MLNSPRSSEHRYRGTALVALLALSLLAVTAPAALAQDAKFDIQYTADKTLTDMATFQAIPGQTLVIELYGTGYTGSLGTEGSFKLSDPTAIDGSSLVTSNVGGPYMLFLTPSLSEDTINLSHGGLAPLSESGTDLKYLGSLTLALASSFTEFTITLTGVDFGNGTTITPNQVITVTPYVRTVSVAADLNPLPGNQALLSAKGNPGGRFPVQVFAEGVEGLTAYEIQVQFDASAVDAARTGYMASLPFSVTSGTGGSPMLPPAGSSSARAGADVRVTAGDRTYTPSGLTAKAQAGDVVVVEFFGSGYEAVNGFQALVRASDPAAIASLDAGTSSAFPLKLALPEQEAGLITLNHGSLMPATSSGTELQFLGSLRITLSADFAGLSLSLESLAFLVGEQSDAVAPNAVLTVEPVGGGAYAQVVEVEGNTLTLRASSATAVDGDLKLGTFAFLTTSTFRESTTLTISKVVLTEGEMQQTLTPGAELVLKSVVTDAPVVTRPPIPVTVTDTKAIIVWETNKAATGTVAYGADPANLDLTATEETILRKHRVTLEGLSPTTRYFLQVTATDAQSRTSDAFPPKPVSLYTRAEDTKPPRILKGPAAVGVTPRAAQIVLMTDEASTVTVAYGTAEDALTGTAEVTVARVEHRIPLTGLELGQKYYYKVTAADLKAQSAESAVRSFTTLATADARPPRILGRPTVLGRTTSSALVGWLTDENSSSAVFYGLDREALSDSSVVDESVRSHRVSLANLLSDTTYFYQVRSVDATGNPVLSNTFSFRTTSTEDTSAPKIVRPPIVPKRSDTEAMIRWVTNEPVTAAVQVATTVDVYDDTTGTVGETFTLSTPTRAPEVTLTNLTKSTKYYYKTLSTDLTGNGPTQNKGQRWFATRFRADSKAPVVLGRPTAVGRTNESAIITWTANEPHSALVEYRPSGEAEFSGSVEGIDLTQQHSISLSGLAAGAEYEYQVTVTDADANAMTTPVFKFKTKSAADNDAPSIVQGPVARNITASSATIYWVTDEPADSKVMYGATTAYTEVVEDATGEVVHSVTLTDLEVGTTYHYAVGSADQAGNLVTTDAAGSVLGVSADNAFTTRAAEDDKPPVIVRGPDVIIRKKKAVIRWRTDEPATSRVEMGVPPGSAESEVEGAPVFGEASQLVFEKNKMRIRHRIVLTDLDGGTPYKFLVSSTDASGNTYTWTPPSSSGKLQPPGGFGSFTTTTQEDTQFPVITAGPSVVASTASSITVEWSTDESSNSAVEFGTSADALSSQEVSGDSETAHQMVLTKLAAGTTYAYKVASTDVSGNGATESQVAYGSTLSDVDLSAPVITTAPSVIYKNDRSATVSWVTNEASDAEVSYGVAEDALLEVRSDPEFGTEHTMTLTNLLASTTYYFKVASKDQSNNGPAESAAISFATDAAPDTQAPVISEVAAVALDSTAVITWQTDEVSDSSVRFGTSESSLDFNQGDAEDVTSHRVVLANLTPSTAYTFTVESIDRADNKSDASAAATFTTVAAGAVQAPGAPTALAAAAGNGAVKLSWTAPDPASGVTGYTVERATDGTFSPVATTDPVTEYVDATVQNDTAYQYRVLSVGLTQLSSDPTDATDAVTPSAGSGPGAPTLYTVQGDPLSPTVVINNSAPLSAGDVLTYSFQVSTQNDFSDAVTLATGVAAGAGLGAGDPSGITAWAVDKVLTDGSTYYWRAKSSDGTFDSAYLSGNFVVDADAPERPGDFDGDSTVGFADFLVLVSTFNKGIGDTGYSAVADLSGDGQVGFPDFIALVGVFNRQYIVGTGTGKPVTPIAISYGIDPSTRLELVGRVVSAEENSELTVDVVAADASNLKGYGVRLSYDPGTLEFVGAATGAGSLLTSEGREAELFGTLSHNAEEGDLFIAGAVTVGSPVSGDGTIAQLRFRLIQGHPQGDLAEIVEGLIIDGKLAINTAQNLGDRLTLVPRDFALERNYPNPFNPQTTIRYSVADAGKVAVRIYNVLGQEVVTLVNEDHLPGFYAVRWNGRDRVGRAVASGVYLYRMEAVGFSQVQKMLFLK